jgi:hypothetical protein
MRKLMEQPVHRTLTVAIALFLNLLQHQGFAGAADIKYHQNSKIQQNRVEEKLYCCPYKFSGSDFDF